MRTIALTAIACALIGSAAAEEGCIWAKEIDGFKDATRTSIVLTDGGQEYLAEFQGTCVGIELAEGLAVEAATSCLMEGDKIVFRDASGSPQRCFIQSLTKVEKTKKPS